MPRADTEFPRLAGRRAGGGWVDRAERVSTRHQGRGKRMMKKHCREKRIQHTGVEALLNFCIIASAARWIERLLVHAVVLCRPEISTQSCRMSQTSSSPQVQRQSNQKVVFVPKTSPVSSSSLFAVCLSIGNCSNVSWPLL